MARYSYYYNPVSGDIKKVSIAEKKAYDEHFREERWTKLLDNETTIPSLIAVITAVSGTAFAGWLLSLIFDYSKEEGITLDEKVRNAWSGAVYGGTLTANIIVKPLTGRGDETITLPGDVQPPVSITYNDLWNYAKTRIFTIGAVA
jgi:hypothetical protein